MGLLVEKSGKVTLRDVKMDSGFQIAEMSQYVRNHISQGKLTHSFAANCVHNSNSWTQGGITLNNVAGIIAYTVMVINPSTTDVRSGKLTGENVIERLSPLNLKQRDSEDVLTHKFDIKSVSAQTAVNWQQTCELIGSFLATLFIKSKNGLIDADEIETGGKVQSVLREIVNLHIEVGYITSSSEVLSLTQVKIGSSEYQSALTLNLAKGEVDDSQFITP